MFTLFACALSSLYVIFLSKPLFFNAAWYMPTFLPKTFLLHDTFVKHLDIAFGISAIMWWMVWLYIDVNYWKLVDNGAVPTIKFSIAKRVKGNAFINNCNLCLSEEAFIIRNLDDVNMLNKRWEFISKCRHINKRLLNRVKDDSNDWL